MQIQDYSQLYMAPTPMAIPPPAKFRCEEILRLFLFICLCVYAVGHILFIPVELLMVAFCHDPDLHAAANMLYILYGVKYVAVLLMFYCAYHHTNLWQKHHHYVLYAFGILIGIVTGFFVFMIYQAHEQLKIHGFGHVYDHPFYYDFVCFMVCGIQGVFYIFYLACTHPPALYYSPYPGYEMVPTYGSHAMRELQTVAQMEVPMRYAFTEQGIIPVMGSHAMRELQDMPKTELKQPEAPKVEVPKQPEAPKTEAPKQEEKKFEGIRLPIYYFPA